MKVQVLKYANDGNTLVRPYKELTAIEGIDNVFYYSEPDQWQPNNPICYLVFKAGELYAQLESFRLQWIESNKDKIIQVRDNLKTVIRESNWISTLYIEIFKALGEDWQSLVDKREMIKQERERKEQIKKEEANRILAERAAKRQQDLLTAFDLLVSGEKIDKTLFVELCQLKGIKIHPRTAGMLGDCKAGTMIGVSQAYVIHRNAKSIKLDKVFEVAKQLVAVAGVDSPLNVNADNLQNLQ